MTGTLIALDPATPFAREAWAELDRVDREVGLDPGMFPFPEPARPKVKPPRSGNQSWGHGPTSTDIGPDCRCQYCHDVMARRFRTMREERACRECGRAASAHQTFDVHQWTTLTDAAERATV